MNDANPKRKISPANLPAHPFWLLLCYLQTQRDNRRNNKRAEDKPQLVPNVRLQDVEFFSPSLGRNTTYRVLLPEIIRPNTKLPVVYLLHAAGDTFQGWSNDSDISQFAARGLILVMPEGGFSHYVNPVSGPRELYEDFLTQDLIADVESRFPASNKRAILGPSMGGFGAIHIALAHPDQYAFAAGISAALNVVENKFNPRRPDTWLMLRRVFGAPNSRHHNQRNPFHHIQTLSPATAPFLYLACGSEDHLLPVNRRFADQLQHHNLPHHFHVIPGHHDWDQWNAQVPLIFESLLHHLNK